MKKLADASDDHESLSESLLVLECEAAQLFQALVTKSAPRRFTVAPKVAKAVSQTILLLSFARLNVKFSKNQYEDNQKSRGGLTLKLLPHRPYGAAHLLFYPVALSSRRAARQAALSPGRARTVPAESVGLPARDSRADKFQVRYDFNRFVQFLIPSLRSIHNRGAMAGAAALPLSDILIVVHDHLGSCPYDDSNQLDCLSRSRDMHLTLFAGCC